MIRRIAEEMGLTAQTLDSPRDESSGKVVEKGMVHGLPFFPDYSPDSHKVGIIATEAPGGILQELRWDSLPEECSGTCYVVVRGKEVGLFESM